MKRLVSILIILLAAVPAFSQGHVTRAMENERDRMEAEARMRASSGLDRSMLMSWALDEQGDTVFLAQLDPVWCFGHPNRRRKEWRKYYKLVYNFAKVYPFALASGRVQAIVDSTIAADNMNALKRDRYIAEVQSELFKDFEKPLRNMSITQGTVLLKLIDRETGQSSYTIIKTYKNGIAAGFWQGIAKLFDNDLKSQYDPEGEDKDIEELVQHWHDGTFRDLYYSIFFEEPPVVNVPQRFN